MTQNRTPGSAAPHPSWCDTSTCTIAESWPYGCHQSASLVVVADPPVGVVAELHLASTRQLHIALDKLLSTATA
jgi:hypothetical protein